LACDLATGVAAAALITGTAFAQEPALAAEPDSNEIVVTAQKRAENVQDIPKSVEVLSSKTLLESGINNVQDLARLSPSIQGAGADRSPPAIRGIASFAYSIGVQAQTGVVLDDIPQPNFSTLADELSDVERVEILPGPQSTLSGRNAAGGLINIVTRSPSTSLKANLTAEVTDDHQKRFAGYVTGPLSDTVGFSLSGFWNDWDGPLYNRATGNRVGGYDRYGLRGKLKFQPTDRLSATVTGFYVENKAPTLALTAGYAYVGLYNNVASFFDPRPLTTLLGYAPGAYSHDVFSAQEGESRSKDYGGSLRIDYDADFGTISSISSISRSDNDTLTPLVAFRASDSPFLAPISVTQNYKVDYKTQEFRLTSPSGSSRFQYTLGAIYSDTKIYEPYARPILFPVNWDRTAITRSLAVYGRGTYEVVPGTFLTGGLRYQHDYQSYDWNFVDGSAPRSTGSNKYDFVAGEASIRQELSDHASAYFTYANAQTGKAYDLEDAASAGTNGLTPVDSEKVQSYEGGFKTQWLDNRLTFNVAIFSASYKNYQIQSALLPPGGGLPSIRLLSIGKVRTRGVELSSSFAVTPDLRLSGAATWMDAEIRDYPNPICYTGQTDQASCLTGGTGLQANLGGTDMPGAAHFKAVGSVNYTLRLPSLPFDLTLGAQGRYQSSVHTFVLNDPASFIKPFGTANLVLGVQDHDAKYKLQLFVNNLFDKQYYSTLARDTVTTPVGGSTTANAVFATYARDSRRYGGLRLTIDY
jgi:iron complex outermembrane receptor protein